MTHTPQEMAPKVNPWHGSMNAAYRREHDGTTVIINGRFSMTYLVHINDDRLSVPDNEKDTLEKVVLAAVAAGGDFVDIPDTAPGTTRFLITPATTVHLRRQPEVRTDREQDIWIPDLSFVDFDEEASQPGCL